MRKTTTTTTSRGKVGPKSLKLRDARRQIWCECARREEVCVGQALGALTSAFVFKLKHEVTAEASARAAGAAASSVGAPSGAALLQQWCKIGVLMGWESLLSTFDVRGPIRQLFSFVLLILA